MTPTNNGRGVLPFNAEPRLATSLFVTTAPLSATVPNASGRRFSLITVPRGAQITVDLFTLEKRQLTAFTWQGRACQAFSHDVRRRAVAV